MWKSRLAAPVISEKAGKKYFCITLPKDENYCGQKIINGRVWSMEEALIIINDA